MNSKINFKTKFIYPIVPFVIILSHKQLMIFIIIPLILSFLEISVLLLFLYFDGLVLVLLLACLLVGLLQVIFVFLSGDLQFYFSKIALFLLRKSFIILHFRFFYTFIWNFLFRGFYLFLKFFYMRSLCFFEN